MTKKELQESIIELLDFEFKEGYPKASYIYAANQVIEGLCEFAKLSGIKSTHLVAKELFGTFKSSDLWDITYKFCCGLGNTINMRIPVFLNKSK